ncbi:hypothetical protein GCM10009422_10050 [Brevundimonas kwangchunensis]|uniref:DoxX family protein n=1 Tax=Brevundimonas kwangchunensis TaxID=322163 RepID=A0ABN1GQX9_9CAUL
MIDRLMLPGLARGDGVAFALLRLYLGGFLVWGVWDNIVSAERIPEFETFLTGLNCPMPAIAAPMSVWAQLLIGLLLIPGLFTRIAGLLLAVNFAVAIWLLSGLQAPGEALARELFGPMMCVLAGLVFATHGGGRLSADTVVFDRR